MHVLPRAGEGELAREPDGPPLSVPVLAGAGAVGIKLPRVQPLCGAPPQLFDRRIPGAAGAGGWPS